MTDGGQVCCLRNIESSVQFTTHFSNTQVHAQVTVLYDVVAYVVDLLQIVLPAPAHTGRPHLLCALYISLPIHDSVSYSMQRSSWSQYYLASSNVHLTYMQDQHIFHLYDLLPMRALKPASTVSLQRHIISSLVWVLHPHLRLASHAQTRHLHCNHMVASIQAIHMCLVDH